VEKPIHHVSASSHQLELLQVLRGLAALTVVMYHSNQLDEGLHMPGIPWWRPVLELGWSGVDCFFCLSGFIITWVHGKDIGRPERAKDFVLKRFTRIYPPLLALIIIKISLLQMVLFTHSAHFPSNPIERGYRAIFLLPAMKDTPLIISAWTLTYEVFFYGLFFSAIVLGKRFAIIGMAIWISTIVVYNLTAVGLPNSESTNFVFNPYNLEFLGGVGIALLAKRSIPFPVVAGLCVVSITTFISGTGFGWISSVHSLQAGGPIYLLQKVVLAIVFPLIILTLIQLEIRYRVKAFKPLVFLGAASYSLYLVHFELINPFDRFGPGWLQGSHLLHVSFLISIALIAGIGYYLLIEKPLLRKARHLFFPFRDKHVSEQPSG
jgi:exopolysaccharide production protein ExoZ